MGNKAKNTTLKIVDTVDFPLATPSNFEACQEAISKALEAVETTRAQLACLNFQAFFAKHPHIQAVEFDGNWESDDEGGSYFSLSASFAFSNGTDEDDEDSDEHWELSEEASDMLGNWGETISGETFKRIDGVERLGQLLLTKDAYAKWRSELEKIDIEQSTGEATASEAEAIRL